MKLKTALNTLLIGSVLAMSGCGGGGDTTTPTVSTPTTPTTPTVPTPTTPTVSTSAVFTTDYLAGKTYYNYITEYTTNGDGTPNYKSTAQFNYSADASTVEVIDIKTGDNYGSNIGVTLTGNKRSLEVNSATVNDDYLFQMTNNYIITLKPSAISLGTESQQSDNGQALFQQFLTENTLTKTKRIDLEKQNPWYIIYFNSTAIDNKWDAQCSAKITVQDDNNFIFTYKQNGTNKQQTGTGDYADSASFIGANQDTMIWVKSDNKYEFWFKDLTRLEEFGTSFSPESISSCLTYFPTN